MSVGPWQILLILVIVLIIFGAGKLPRVMGDLAKGIKNFKRGMNEEPGAGEEPKAEPKSIDADTSKADIADAEPAKSADKDVAAKS